VDAEAIEPVTAALFGLDGFGVLTAADAGGELELMIETTADLVGVPGVRGGRDCEGSALELGRDLPIAGRPVVLCWAKWIWACDHQLCPKRTWTETHEAIGPRAVLTARVAVAAVGQVRVGATVAGQARVRVSWHPVMRQVRHLGVPVVEDPARLDRVTAIGVG
jgi:hypothetical protein